MLYIIEFKILLNLFEEEVLKKEFFNEEIFIIKNR